ncbi:CD209 antigen-like [Melanotaenia boesemani]|uniref:CD209 antigen-like n=1 Tax=Melanotaenia boesemani TaxID=1250792 RepID=UPI001C050708|nr:CD209 antigen-like [Melanotaenia boesemani]
MEDRENSGSIYNKLVSQEEITEDDDPLYSNQENEQVSMSTVRPESMLNLYRLLTVSLTVLAVILLAVDIGLGIYYNNLANGNIVADIGNELTKLQASYDAAAQNLDNAKKQLENEVSKTDFIKWELEHQVRRNKDYEKQAENMQMEIAALKSHLPMIRNGCRYCLSGWTFMNSMCYFFPFSETFSRVTWQDARQSCKRQGGDLAVIDSREKHMAVTNLINSNFDHSRPSSLNGFWIGLRDVEEEGTWKWLDGTTLTEGYWEEEQSNQPNHADCVAVYPKLNPFRVWKDVPCSYNLKWICEMKPRSSE